MIIYEQLQEDEAKRLKAKNIIRAYADDALSKYGFIYGTHSRYSTGDTMYYRNKSKDWQMINFEFIPSSPYRVKIKLVSKKSGELKIEHFVPGVIYQWSFNTINELEGNCPSIINCAIKYGIRVLYMNSLKQQWPTWQNEFAELYHNREKLALEFTQKYDFPDDPFYIDIKRLEYILANRTNESFYNVDTKILK